MKVAIITDQHFGMRKGSKIFHDFIGKFYNDTFFPYLEENNIDIELFEMLNILINDLDKQNKIASNCKKMDRPKAVERIVDIIDELIDK